MQAKLDMADVTTHRLCAKIEELKLYRLGNINEIIFLEKRVVELENTVKEQRSVIDGLEKELEERMKL